jgi:mRNA interferase MazF
MDLARGKIYRVNLEPTIGSEQQGTARPCVILSSSQLNGKFKHIGIVPLSSSAKALPPIVVSVPSAGLNSVALCHQMKTIDKTRIGKYVGDISPADMTAIENGVRRVFGL